MNVGIAGAGFIGGGTASLALDGGQGAMVGNSRGPETLGSIASGIGARTGTFEEAIAFANVVLAAIPFNAIGTMPAALPTGRVVTDANNYHPERDGQNAGPDDRVDVTTKMLARRLPGARVEDVHRHSRRRPAEGRPAAELRGPARPGGSGARRAGRARLLAQVRRP